jgi:pimeloyl-ACP methyl ester carboxylesterase
MTCPGRAPSGGGQGSRQRFELPTWPSEGGCRQYRLADGDVRAGRPDLRRGPSGSSADERFDVGEVAALVRAGKGPGKMPGPLDADAAVGCTSDPADGFGITDWADCPARFLAAIGLREANLLGLSWGGLLAQEFYRLYPPGCSAH